MTGIERIAKECARQIELGYDAAHDDGHVLGELATAAACYAAYAAGKDDIKVLRFDRDQTACDAWPFEAEADNRGKISPERLLEIAGALIAAELDRLERARERV